MRVYTFSREIMKKGPINHYGKLGFRLHREVVCLEAETEQEALEKLAPYNKSKHIKFKKDYSLHKNPGLKCDEIIDMGEVPLYD